MRRRSGCALALLLASVLPLAGQAGSPPDPFAGIRREQLANGLTVWIKPMPGAASTSISLVVPHGGDRDPVGREELAHVVEHALFSAQDERTEDQITRDIADRGGSFNASTSPDRTLIWVSVAREHGPFALEWLHDRVRPREWNERHMRGIRDAVALELRLGPRSALGFLRDEYLLNPALLPPGFWTREFGLRPPEYRRADLYAALQRTTAEDVAEFHRLYYNPSRMSLLIAGDLDPQRALESVEKTFGQILVWPEAPPPQAPRLRRTATRRFFWNLRDDVRFNLAFRIDSLNAEDHVRLLFAQQLLERRLIRRLRWDEEPAVYGVGSSLVQRAGVAVLSFDARIRPDAYARARGVIEDELQRLRHGRYPPGEFEQDRDAIDLRLRLNNGTPAALRTWHGSTFYRTDVHPTLPLLGTRFAAMTPGEVAEVARAQLGPAREVLSVERPLPLRQGAAAAIPLGALLLGMAVARRVFITPMDLTHLRYVARLRPPLAILVPGTALALVTLLIGLRLVAAGAHHAAAAFLWAQDSFLLQALSFVAALAFATVLGAAVLALIPRKVLVLQQEIRIKYLAYRSSVIPREELIDVCLAGYGDVLRSGRALRTIPLAFGWRRPAALIRTRHGPDWLVATRDPAELVAALATMQKRRQPGHDVWLAAAGADS